VVKAATLAGIGRDWVRLILTDARGAMDAAALDRALADDAKAGRRP
jgi:glutamate/tyrosine decarboxylase-like PLP-dependent enzyme